MLCDWVTLQREQSSGHGRIELFFRFSTPCIASQSGTGLSKAVNFAPSTKPTMPLFRISPKTGVDRIGTVKYGMLAHNVLAVRIAYCRASPSNSPAVISLILSRSHANAPSPLWRYAAPTMYEYTPHPCLRAVAGSNLSLGKLVTGRFSTDPLIEKTCGSTSRRRKLCT